jgi:N-acetylneuraminate synthase/N,N'-diacetyllegionaminate synthase
MIAPRDFRALERVFIVAEIGVNHEGDVDVAEDLIAKASTCGADAVKFQTFTAETYVSTIQPERRERAGRFQLSHDQFRRLAARAARENVTFFSTPLHPDDADFLDTVAPMFKIASGDLTYIDLIRHVAAKSKPMIISTGLGTEDEIRAAIAAANAGQPGIAEKGGLMLMHCVAAYPTPAEEANVRNIGWLQRTFGLPVGYSDHTLGTKACELAVAAGARALEKHFTYRKENQAFHDHLLSADSADMTALVTAVRAAEVYLGSETRARGPSESKLLQHMRRAVGARVEIPAGAPVEADWLVPLRPAWGIDVADIGRVIGRRLKRTVPAGDLIKDEDLA